jgi:hypothetical protein
MLWRAITLLVVALASGCWLVSSFDFPADGGKTDAPSPVPVSLVQGTWKSFGNEAYAHAEAFEMDVQAGDTLIVAFDYPSSSQAPSVTDSFGNHFLSMHVEESTQPPDGSWFEVYFVKTAKGGHDDVTVTLDGTTLLDLYLAEFSGPLTYAATTVTTGNAPEKQAINDIASPTATLDYTDASRALIVGFVVADNVVPGTSFMNTSTAVSPSGLLEYAVTDRVTAPVSASATLMCDSRWGISMVAFPAP